MARPPKRKNHVSNETLVLIDGLAKIMAIDFPLKGWKDLSLDLINDFTSAALGRLNLPLLLQNTSHVYRHHWHSLVLAYDLDILLQSKSSW
jgi:hypothetical protein